MISAVARRQIGHGCNTPRLTRQDGADIQDLSSPSQRPLTVREDKMKPLIVGGDVKSTTSNGFILRTWSRLSNILLDPATGTATSAFEKLRAARRIRRPEFQAFGMAIGLFPIVATARSGESFFGIDFLLICTVLFFGMQIGMMVNCLADRDADEVFKSAQADAVRALGVRNVLAQVAVTAFLQGVFFVVLVVRAQSLLLLALSILAAFLSVQYSLPPLHLKSRGVVEILTIGITTIVIPGLVILISARHHVDWIDVLAVAGFAGIMCSLILVETAEDVPEDRKFGVKTTAVQLGLIRTMYFAMILDVVGLCVVVYTIASRHHIRPETLVVVVSGLLPLIYLLRIARSMRGLDENRHIETLRAHSRYLPIVLASTGAGIVIGMFLSSGALSG